MISARTVLASVVGANNQQRGMNMRPEIKLSGKSMEQRIADRLKPSGIGRGTQPDHMVTHGSGPTRTVTSINHSAGHVPLPGRGDKEQGR
jgi:hypothetical protein